MHIRPSKCFVEFGATEPNLLDYLENGWYGIFIEPHPIALLDLTEILRAYPKENYKIISGCVTGDRPDFTAFHTVRSLRWWDRIGEASTHYGDRSTQPIYFPLLTLDMIVAAAPYPVERFEIDCEGTEDEIFEKYSFEVRPKEIKVACHPQEKIKRKLTPIFEKHGYTVETPDKEHLFCTRKDT